MSVAAAWRALLAEGPRSAVARALDRAADRRREAAFLEVSAATLRDRWRGRVDVLHVLGVPLRRSSGGVEQQFLARLDGEREHRVNGATACLVPSGRGWRLELASPASREVVRYSSSAAGDVSFVAAAALESTGARLLHIENVAGLPLTALSGLAAQLPTVLSVHDLSLFCPRPHVLPIPAAGGCRWSDATCALCAADPNLPADYGPERRAETVRLLDEVRAIVFPSAFLAAEVERRLGVELGDRSRVVVPAVELRHLPRATHRPPGRHAAYVGSVYAHKGARVLCAAAPGLLAAGIRVSAYGGGDPQLLGELRRAGVRVRGYYRAGSLPARLRADAVDLALLLSIWPESHGLTLDECAHAGVPVAAFDQGAFGDRLRDSGRLIPIATGAEGVVAIARSFLTNAAPPPAATLPLESSSPAEAASAYREIYDRLASFG